MKTILTVAVATLFAMVAARAEVVSKGGATALSSAPEVRTSANATKPMGCGMCKSEFVTSTSVSTKGTAPATATVERHACPSCGTKWVSTGHGKAKVETPVHTCGMCKS